MIKKNLLSLIKVYINLNQTFNGCLIDNSELIDIENDINASFAKEYNVLLKGISGMEKINLSTLNSPNNEEYVKNMVAIYTSLNRLENHFIDLREAHTKISKTFRSIVKDNIEDTELLESENEES
ncbi:hypothetical protein [Streptococcus acidominimus]|uniref:Uncharacterized protein n=1 Tax=Streptococcus acidominimus TaxID=1326 RepID=A0A1Q8EEJ0_STRAI|nr:hypothetical protein [Streptococcus acidominimus]OLF50219.1 hypothetical protein BU200_02925 [Streptococcus acidominimus]SUN06685.1 Uncharacterised protein [Streptococcus acidominimus]